MSSEDEIRMHRRRITLADGRYLIFFTFDDGPVPSSDKPDAARHRAEDPQPRAEAGEERRV